MAITNHCVDPVDAGAYVIGEPPGDASGELALGVDGNWPTSPGMAPSDWLVAIALI